MSMIDRLRRLADHLDTDDADAQALACWLRGGCQGPFLARLDRPNGPGYSASLTERLAARDKLLRQMPRGPRSVRELALLWRSYHCKKWQADRRGPNPYDPDRLEWWWFEALTLRDLPLTYEQLRIVLRDPGGNAS